jgi:hypothetical protein
VPRQTLPAIAILVLFGTAAAAAQAQDRDPFDDAVRQQQDLRQRQVSQVSRAQARVTDPYTLDVDGARPRTEPVPPAAPLAPRGRRPFAPLGWILGGAVLAAAVLFWAFRARETDVASRRP